MYCSQSKDGQGDFATIAIKDGRVEFRFDTGSGPAILRSGVPINAGEWYTILVERKLDIVYFQNTAIITTRTPLPVTRR